METWDELQARHIRERGAYVALRAIEGGGIQWAAHDIGISSSAAYRYLRDAEINSREVTRLHKAGAKREGELMDRITKTLERSHPDYRAKVARFMGVYHPPSPDAGKPWQGAAE